MRIAIFDFDGTLYSKETFQLMMDHLKSHPVHGHRYRAFFKAILPPYIGSKMKLVPVRIMRERSVQAYLAALHSFSQKELEEYFSEIAVKMEKDFNPAVAERLKQHAANGDYVMVVSGAFSPLLHSATAGFPITSIIGTDVPYAEGVLDTKQKISHVQGEKKVERITESLADERIDWENSYAYGDSHSDLPVLELVGNPVAVHPEQKLRTIAERRGWEIIQ